jgi:hypothetical protein
VAHLCSNARAQRFGVGENKRGINSRFVNLNAVFGLINCRFTYLLPPRGGTRIEAANADSVP